MNAKDLEVGMVVEVEAGLRMINGVSRGWVHLLDENAEPSKVRLKEIVRIVEELEEEEAIRSMAATLRAARARYVKVVAYSGNASMDNDDIIAKALRGMSPTDVAGLADRVCGEELGFHHAKYNHLNRGAIRMNSGNKIRGAIKRGDISADEVVAMVI